jgi:hypothetical protein
MKEIWIVEEGYDMGEKGCEERMADGQTIDDQGYFWTGNILQKGIFNAHHRPITIRGP